MQRLDEATSQQSEKGGVTATEIGDSDKKNKKKKRQNRKNNYIKAKEWGMGEGGGRRDHRRGKTK
jgi:hypothetical protein